MQDSGTPGPGGQSCCCWCRSLGLASSLDIKLSAGVAGARGARWTSGPACQVPGRQRTAALLRPGASRTGPRRSILGGVDRKKAAGPPGSAGADQGEAQTAREHAADEREALADDRERKAEERERDLDERGRRLGAAVESLEQRTLEIVERSRALLEASGQRLNRQEPAVTGPSAPAAPASRNRPGIGRISGA